MLIFLAGLLVGSFTVLLTMSLMVAAKRGDQRLEVFESKRNYRKMGARH